MSPYMRELRAAVGTHLLLIPAVAAVVHDATGKVLVLRTRSGHWSLPAGAIDPGETPQQAVVRETREEAGVEVTVDRLLAAVGGEAYRIQYDNGDLVEATICVFACSIVGGTLDCDGVETVEFRWCSPEDAAALLTVAYPVELLQPR